MKFVITLLLAIVCAEGFAQNSVEYIEFTDTVNRFTIQVPPGWQYGVDKNNPNIKLVAYRTYSGSGQRATEHFSLNVLNKPNSSLNEEYNMLIEALTASGNFNKTEEGVAAIHGQTYRWFVELLRVSQQDTRMNLVFVTYKNGRTYLLTFTAFPGTFPEYRPLFQEVANSLVIH